MQAFLSFLFPSRSLAPKNTEFISREIHLSEDLSDYGDASKAVRVGYLVIIFGLGAFLLWAFFAPIGEGVPAQGTVVVESKRKQVSHLTGGTIAKVLVSENQIVKEGDTLLIVDPSRAQTALNSVLNDYLTSTAKLARLTAEQGGSNKIQFTEETIALADEIGRNDVLSGQEQLFRVRRESVISEQNILRETLNASQIQSIGAKQLLSSKSYQAALLKQDVESNRSLVEEGYAPRNRLNELERQLAETTGSVAELQTRIAREASTGSEIQLRLLQRRQEYLKEVESLLAETRREVGTLGERVKDARLELDRSVITAPVSGQVVGMLAQAPGSIITAGSKLLEIVPDNDKLLLEVQVPINIIQRVMPGLETDIRITSFPNVPVLLVEGKVQSVSSDRFEPQGQAPYYLARVEVSPIGLTQLGGRQLRPGMTADVVIKTGERTFMAYLLAPFSRQFFSAFREP